MNKEEPFRDQAERLKQRIQKINQEVEEYGDKLPPREQVHRQRKKKTKWKLRFPVIRLLAVCFILLPLIIFSVISYRENSKKIMGTEKTTTESVGYETINLDNHENEVTNVEPEKQEVSDSTVDSSEEQSEEPVVEEPGNDSGQSNTPSQPPSPNQISTDQQQTDKNSNTTNETKKTEAATMKYHTVKPGEGLYKIAKNYYHSQKGIEIIKRANNLTSDNIYAGQVLKIPLGN